MIEIVGNMVRADGRLWQILEVDGTSVHLLDGVDGICIEVKDPILLAALKEMPTAS